jgi:anti-sigma28 factor (negative regulator of flagellin synthesis)
MTSESERPASGAPSSPEEPTLTTQLQALRTTFEPWTNRWTRRGNKIENIKRAIADGTYHVSAGEVSRKIIDSIGDP